MYICLADSNILTNIVPCSDGPTVMLANNQTIKPTHRALLNAPALPIEAREAWMFPDLKRSLIAIKPLCDADLVATFRKDRVDIHNAEGNLLLTGPRCTETHLWNVPISIVVNDSANAVVEPITDHCYVMLSEHRTQHEVVAYHHATMFSPAIKTLKEAVKRGFVTIPGLSYEALCKYPPNSDATAMGHMRGTAFKQRAKRHPEEEHDDYFPEVLFKKRTSVNQHEPASVASATIAIPIDMRHHADLSGRLPVPSYDGYEYILVFFCAYANYIHFEAMKNRTAAEYVRAHSKAYDFFLKGGIRSSFLRLDNEASAQLIDFCDKKSPRIQMEFVPPNSHRANKTERCMGTAKDHIISGMNTCDPDFPVRAWTKLLPQAELTLNKLRQSGISHHMSAWQQLFGKHDYLNVPLAPPGMRIVVHEPPSVRGTWANHGVKGFYVGHAPQHHKCYTVFIPATNTTRIANTVSWFPPPGWKLPGASPFDTTSALLEQLVDHLRAHGPNILSNERQPLPPAGSLIATFMDYIARTRDSDAAPAPEQRVPTPAVPPGFLARPAPPSASNEVTLGASEILAQQLALEDAAIIRARTPPGDEALARTSATQLALEEAATIRARAPPDDEALAQRLTDDEELPAKHADEEPPDSGPTTGAYGNIKRRRRTKKPKQPLAVTSPPPNKEQGPPPSNATTLPPSPRPAKPLKHGVGTLFRKLFDAGLFDGRVSSIGPTTKKGQSRIVVYSDGDREQLHLYEIDAHIKRHGKPTQSVNIAIDKYVKPHGTQTPVANLALTTPNDIHAMIEKLGMDLPTIAKLHGLEYSLANAALRSEGVAPITYKSVLLGPQKHLWYKAISTELDKLLKGGADAVMRGIYAKDVPQGRHVAYYNPQVREKMRDLELLLRVRGTYGGNTSDYQGDVSALVADITTVKILLNLAISEAGYSVLTADITDFYLGSPLERKEYMFIRKDQLTPDIIDKYDLGKFLHTRRNTEGIVVEISKGIYGLPQAGRVAQIRLNEHLAKHGYHQTKNTPCLYKHESRPTYFTLIVDDFLTITKSDEDRQHFLDTLKSLYDIKYDLEARKYIGITITQDKSKRWIKLSVPGYVAATLRRFGISPLKHRTDAPSPYTKPRYHDKRQQMATVDDTKPLGPKETKFIQEVVGVLGWYARAVDCTILCAVNKLASRQARPTEAVLSDTMQLLQYLATHPDATIVFRPSEMQLAVHSDASYLSETQARSRAAGLFVLTYRNKLGHADANNGPIDCMSSMIKSVVSSAFEAEYAAMFMNGQNAEPIRNTLEDLGYPQGATPIISDNECAVGIANRTVKQKRSKATDMKYHWIRDRVDQGHFVVSWAPGPTNLADYFTKNHPASHHKLMRSKYVEN